MLRRGRAGRWFAKYIQKSIFEDLSPGANINGGDAGYGSENEVGADDDKNNNKLLKKRKRRYQDLQEYLDINGGAETQF